jgi:molybdopterin-guanine dinucleotide biosynthesis protein MobB
MNRIHIVGGKNHGKTRLVVELVEEFTRQGLRVGTVKHTHHRHELDTPGKDSHRHRTAGAAVVGILSQSMSAVFLPVEPDHDGVDRYDALAPLFAGCDIVLVEGDSQSPAPKVEVYRAIRQTPPLARADASILAVVTDDSPDVPMPILPRSDVPRLASWLRAHADCSIETSRR